MRTVDPSDYQLWHARGYPCKELAWYATDDDTVLGVIVLDEIDNDYGWVTVTQEYQDDDYPRGTYRATKVKVSLPNRAAALKGLRQAMAEEQQRIQNQ